MSAYAPSAEGEAAAVLGVLNTAAAAGGADFLLATAAVTSAAVILPSGPDPDVMSEMSKPASAASFLAYGLEGMRAPAQGRRHQCSEFRQVHRDAARSEPSCPELPDPTVFVSVGNSLLHHGRTKLDIEYAFKKLKFQPFSTTFRPESVQRDFFGSR